MSRVLLLGLLVAPFGVAQVTNGSFEATNPGFAPTAPWIASPLTVVLPAGSCFAEPVLGFPSDGSRWCKVDAGIAAGSDLTNFRTQASRLRQTFTWGTGPSLLSLDVAFVNWEPPTFGANDFMVVEVDDGTTFQQLAFVDVMTGTFPFFSACGTRPATALMHLTVDLAQAFPASTGATPFTLSIYCANGVGALTTSFRSQVYVDDIRLGTCPLSGPLDARFCQDQATGDWTLQNFGPGLPGAELFNLISLTPQTPTGSGLFFGLGFTAEVVEQAFYPLGVPPFHVNLDGNGTFTFGPFTIPPGFMINVDHVAIAVGGGTVTNVSIVRNVTLAP